LCPLEVPARRTHFSLAHFNWGDGYRLMARSLDEWRRGEATTLPAWIKPQLTKLVDAPPDPARCG